MTTCRHTSAPQAILRGATERRRMWLIALRRRCRWDGSGSVRPAEPGIFARGVRQALPEHQGLMPISALSRIRSPTPRETMVFSDDEGRETGSVPRPQSSVQSDESGSADLVAAGVPDLDGAQVP